MCSAQREFDGSEVQSFVPGFSPTSCRLLGPMRCDANAVVITEIADFPANAPINQITTSPTQHNNDDGDRRGRRAGIVALVALESSPLPPTWAASLNRREGPPLLRARRQAASPPALLPTYLCARPLSMEEKKPARIRGRLPLLLLPLLPSGGIRRRARVRGGGGAGVRGTCRAWTTATP